MPPKVAPGDVGRDVGHFGAGIGLGAALGIVQTLVVPRRLDVATFGAWRVFMVYTAYLGLLHIGLADGAFLRWAGRSAAEVGAEWRRVSRWALVVLGAPAAAAVAALPFVHGAVPRAFVAGYAACSVGVNMVALSGYALQAVGDFRGAGRVAAIGPALFALGVVVLPLRTVGQMIAAFSTSFLVAAVVGAVRVRAVTGGGDAATTLPSPVAVVRAGLPVLGANLAAALSLFADRVLVSLTVPLAAFAPYGFASSAMVAASMATQALSRVALSHAARRGGAERARFVDGFHDLVAALAGVAFAGVPAFERLVAWLLPAYVPALPIVRALAVGAPFGVALHVVLVGTLQAHGRVRRQLALELCGLAAVGAACGLALVTRRPLWQVAGAASAAACLTWAVGVAVVRRAVPGARLARARAFAVAGAAQGLALLAALWAFDGAAARTLAYAALAAPTVVAAARAARARGWR